MMRTLELPPGVDPRAWGRIHGESFRHEIGALADIRVYLTQRVGGFSSDEEVLRVAEAHLPILERYDRALYDELCGIAEGAATTPARIVVLNHYTDLRDIDPRSVGAAGDDEGCSIVYAKTPEGPVLAQTWDMHATAIPFTMMLRVPESEHGPEAWLLTLTGCLGMCGVTRQGLAIAINNLHSTDARVGVVWSALVRRALREPSAAAARDHILEAPVGSGHHYFVADDHEAYGIETSGRLREVVFAGTGEGPYVHTNHCTSEVVAAQSRVPPTSSTRERYALMSKDVRDEPVESALDAWERLGDCEGFPRSVCSYLATPQNPHGTATCAGVSIDIGARVMWAQGGFTHNVEPDRFAFGEEGAP
jgi:isopenicillin-N N-acyltransferase like protein